MTYQNIVQYLINNPKVKSCIKVGIISLVLLSAVVLLWPQKDYPEYQAIDIESASSSGFPYVSDSKLYSYNGLTFYSQELSAGSKPKVLFYKSTLPKVSSIAWAGDDGALVNFNPPLYSTSVQRELSNMGENINSSTENYTWYIDFKTGELDLFDTDKIKSGSVLYSEKEGGFYFYRYVPEQDKDIKGRSAMTVGFYNIKSKEYKSTSNQVMTSQVYYLTLCGTDKFLTCIVTRDDKDDKKITLSGLDSEDKFSKLISTTTNILPTSNPDYFIVPLENNNQVELKRISTGASKELNLKFAEPEPIVYIGASGSTNKLPIYVLDNSLSKEPNKNGENNTYLYASGELDPVSLGTSFRKYDTYSGKDKFKERVVLNSGFSQESLTILNTFKGKSFVFAPKNSNYSYLQSLDEAQEKKVLESCVKDPSKDLQYVSSVREFSILIDFKLNIEEELTKFVDCLVSKDSKALSGYSFSIRLVDPATGRFVN